MAHKTAQSVARVMSGAESPRMLSTPTFEEVFVRNEVVSLCLLLNRRAKVMRVVDFRAGASPAKRTAVQSIARRERVEKVVALVERDECAAWARLGFQREGNIPGFYRRSDAFIMGLVVGAQPAARERPVPRVHESGVFSVGHALIDPYAPAEVADDDEEEDVKAVISASVEKTTATARKLAREMADVTGPTVKLTSLEPTDVARRVSAAAKSDRALTGFEPFGRDVARDDVLVSARNYGDLVIGAEIQRCYGNAFVEVLTSPRDERERGFLIAGLRAFCDRLLQGDVVCAFAITPDKDVRMATSFVAAGFRRTGVLRKHLRVRGERCDGLLWSRKLVD